ncbi:LysM peptidoglycan-binding domain-containing protein [Paenarthrobacter sp. NPDC056912]|uniref:LysM peptidoglycan-binding domain-containing protein n=1 Tax=Paenarthrobacter sp. NPDC056912 TaxID=3345965 RepID=UPI00366D4367
MTRTMRNDSALAATILVLGGLLVWVGNDLLRQRQSAISHQQNLSFEHLLGFVTSGIGAAIVIWWTLSLALALLASALSRAGRTAGANAVSKFSPVFMLRLIACVMSLNLLGTTMAQAAAASPEPGWQPTAGTTIGSVHPAWTPASGRNASAQPPPVDPAVTPDPQGRDPRWQPRPPVVDPGLLSPRSPRQSVAPNQEPAVVRAGDSLWSIAAARLGPFATDVEIAVAWPKWYAINRTTIGPDPAVLLPGQVLRPPQPD